MKMRIGIVMLLFAVLLPMLLSFTAFGESEVTAVWCLTDTYCVHFGVQRVFNDSVVIGGHSFPATLRSLASGESYYVLRTWSVHFPEEVTYAIIHVEELNGTWSVLLPSDHVLRLVPGNYHVLLLSGGSWYRLSFNVPMITDLRNITRTYVSAWWQVEWRLGNWNITDFAVVSRPTLTFVFVSGSRLLVFMPYLGVNTSLSLPSMVRMLSVVNGSVYVFLSESVFRLNVSVDGSVGMVPVASVPYVRGFILVRPDSSVLKLSASTILKATVPAVKKIITNLVQRQYDVLGVDVIVKDLVWGTPKWTFTGYVAVPYSVVATFNATVLYNGSVKAVSGVLSLSAVRARIVYNVTVDGRVVRYIIEEPSSGFVLVVSPCGSVSVFRGSLVGVYPCGSDAYLVLSTVYGFNVTVLDANASILETYLAGGSNVTYAGGRLYFVHGSTVVVYSVNGLEKTLLFPEPVKCVVPGVGRLVVVGESGRVYYGSSRYVYVGVDPLVFPVNDTIYYVVGGVVGWVRCGGYPIRVRFIGNIGDRVLVTANGTLYASVVPRSRGMTYVYVPAGRYVVSVVAGGCGERFFVRVPFPSVLMVDLRLLSLTFRVGYSVNGEWLPLQNVTTAYVCGYSVCRAYPVLNATFRARLYPGTYYVYVGGESVVVRVNGSVNVVDVVLPVNWVKVRPLVVFGRWRFVPLFVIMRYSGIEMRFPVVGNVSVIPVIKGAKYYGVVPVFGAVPLVPELWYGRAQQVPSEIVIHLVVPKGYELRSGTLRICGLFSGICQSVVVKGDAVRVELPLPDAVNIMFSSVGFVGKVNETLMPGGSVSLSLSPVRSVITVKVVDYYTHDPLKSLICLSGGECVNATWAKFDVWRGGLYVVSVRRAGYLPANITVNSVNATNYVVALKPASISFVVQVVPKSVPVTIYVYRGDEYIGEFSGKGVINVSVSQPGKYLLLVSPKIRGWGSVRLDVSVVRGMSPVSVTLRKAVVSSTTSRRTGRAGFSVVYVIVVVVVLVVIALILLRERILKVVRGFTLSFPKRGRGRKGGGGSKDRIGKGKVRFLMFVWVLLTVFLILGVFMTPIQAGATWEVKVVDSSGVALAGNYTVVYPDGRVVVGVFNGSFTVSGGVPYCWVSVSVPGFEGVTRLVSGSVTIVLHRLESLISLETFIGNVSTNRGLVGEKARVLVRIYGVQAVNVTYVVYGMSGRARKVGVNVWEFDFVLPNVSVLPVTVRVELNDGSVISRSMIIYVIGTVVRKEKVVVGVPEAINQTFKVLAAVERDLAMLRGNLSLVMGSVSELRELERRLGGVESEISKLSKLSDRVSGVESNLKKLSGDLSSLSGSVALLKDEVGRVKHDMQDVVRTADSVRVMALVAVVLGLLGLILSLSNTVLLKRMRGEVK